MSIFDTGIRPLVDAYIDLKRSEVRNYGDYWSASSAGYCMRKNIFERLGVPHVTVDPRKQRVFESGHIFHEWLQGITKAAGVSIAQELELQDEELMIRGHIDDLVLINDKLILYDIKTAHSRSFTYSKDRPVSHFHRLQVGTYMYMLRNDKTMKDWEGVDATQVSESRILKLSKDDLRMAEKQVFWGDKLESDVLNYWKELNTWWNNKLIPPCTCADHENGFMARMQYNPFWYNNQPCSIAWYEQSKKEGKLS